MKKILEKLKEKWGITSNWDILAIMVVFAISGSSIMFVKPLWFKVFGVTEATPQWLRFMIWIAMVFPTYQAFLIIYGSLFGQFKFFWAKEKAMFDFISRPFRRSKKNVKETD